MRITHEHMWEDIDLYHLNDKTRQCMEYLCDRSYPDLTDGLSDDKYNTYMYAQYLESAMQTLERSDALYDLLAKDVLNLEDKIFDLTKYIHTKDKTIAHLQNEVETLKEQLSLKRVRVDRMSDDGDDLIQYRARSGGQS